MKTVIKFLGYITLVILAASCERDETSVKSLVGTWEYTIQLSFRGTNYDTGQSISESKNFSGTFTWDDNLHGYLMGDIEYSYLDGYVEDGRLGFIEDSFRWSEGGKEYEIFCVWNSVPVERKMKTFTTTAGKHSWVEVQYSNGNEVFGDYVEATFTARKTNL